MNERLAAVFQQLTAFWQGLTVVRRFALVGALVAVLGGTLYAANVSNQEQYGFLFTDLSVDDAASITTKLKELKVPYRIAAGGSAIEVPEQRVHELRLDLAGQGIPKGGGVGFEIFDKTRLGTTEFEQRVNLKRALEGELARTIGTVGSVQTARVHLVLPERSVFTANRENATASVVLKLRQGRTFSKGEVASVLHLVAAAVPGLNADRVAIVSADGTTLHRPKEEGGLGEGDAQVEKEREMAIALENQARAILDRAVGAGHAEIRARVELDAANVERTEEHYDPAKSVVRSEQENLERSGDSTTQTTVAGIPGAGSTVPQAQSVDPNNPNGNAPDPNAPGARFAGSSRTQRTRNFEVDKVVTKTTPVGRRVQRVTLAVLVDGVEKEENGVKSMVPRDRTELDRLEALVKGAVGFDATRGDSIKVESASFYHDPEPPPPPPVVFYKDWRFYAVMVPALALSIWGGLVYNRKRKERLAREAEEAARRAEEEERMRLEAEAEAARQAERLPPPPDPRVLREFLPEAPEVVAWRDRLRKEVFEAVSRDPATAAIVLREWLNAVNQKKDAA